MKLLFIVQGEGRGHLTQALAARSLLAKAGHRVSLVMAGAVGHRDLPDFFVDKIGAPVETFQTPGFRIGKHHRSVRRLGTLIENVIRVPSFARSLERIDRLVRRERPDLVMTFYEPLSGLYRMLYRPPVPFVAVGHQYMFEHPVYRFAPGAAVDRASLLLFTTLTQLGASWKLALSLYPAPDLRRRCLSVVPPLLRPEALARAERLSVREDFFVAYLLNRGYADHVIAWHERYPDRRLECFWDNPDAAEVVRYDSTLRFHRLHDTKFLDLLSRCRGLVCTAGFESIGEAMLFGKPVLSVPVEGHFEQRCNAHEVERLGAGLRGESFDLRLLEDFERCYEPPGDRFRAWVEGAEERVLEVVEAAAAGRRPSPRVGEREGLTASTSTLHAAV